MTHYDIIKLAESVLMTVVKNGVNVQDVGYLKVYEEYTRMEREGHKKTFIVDYLSELYGVPVPTIYRIAKRMRTALSFP